MGIILQNEFFNRKTTVVAKDLLGKYLVRKIKNKTIKLFITEVEAYDGEKDLASHASHGKTERTKVMFDEAGLFYVYLIYGMYWMLNVTTGEKGYPAAILIRGGIYYDDKNDKKIIINGPGKITKFLKITKYQNGKKANKENGLWFESNDIKIKKNQISATKRIGVEYAGKIWANKPYRFILNKII
jgi:DNA-3-methyladenine glycosylase